MRISGPGQNLRRRIGVDPGLIVERHRIHPVDLSRKQRRDASRGVRDRREHHLVDISDRLVPPVRISLPDGLHAGLMADEDEGPRSVGVQPGVGRRRGVHRRGLRRAMRLRPALGEDAPGFPLVDQQRIWRLEQKIDGVVVDLDDLGVRRNAALEVRARAENPMRRENDVVRGEILAFVELHALAQVKAPMQRVQDLPARREARLELHVRSAPDQPLVDRPVDALAEALVDLIGVDRFKLALEREAQDLGFDGRRERRP